MRRLLPFFLVLAFFSCQKERWDAPDYGPAPSVGPAAKADDVSVRLVLRTSSTLTVEWSLTAFSNAHKDNSEVWRIGLYRDRACQDPVVSWTWDAFGMGWSGTGNFHEPAFHFTGLTPGSAYYFKAQSLDGRLASEAVRFETEDFPVVVPGKTGLKPGDVILGENFSEFVWGPDPLRWSVGYVPENMEGMKTIQQASGSDPEGFVQMAEIRHSFPLARFQQKTRLKDWLPIEIPGHETPIRFLSGCVDIADSYHVFARFATPRLTGLGDEYATVRVTFQTAGNLPDYIPSPDGMMIYVIDEEKTFEQTLYNYPFAMAHAASSAVSPGPDGWAEHEVILNNVREKNRIGFRVQDYSTSLLRNVKVELLSYGKVEEKPEPPAFTVSYYARDSALSAWVTAQRGVSYYKASFRMAGSQSWQDVPDSYAETLWDSCVILSPLYGGRNYEVKISAVSYSGEESEPTIMTVKTKYY